MMVVGLAMMFGMFVGWLAAVLLTLANDPDLVARVWWCDMHRELAATHEGCPHGTYDTPCRIHLAGLYDDWRG